MRSEVGAACPRIFGGRCFDFEAVPFVVCVDLDVEDAFETVGVLRADAGALVGFLAAIGFREGAVAPANTLAAVNPITQAAETIFASDFNLALLKLLRS